MINISGRMVYRVFTKTGIVDKNIFDLVYKSMKVSDTENFIFESRYNMPIFPSLTFLEY